MAIMGTHGIKLEKLADMRKYCKPDFRKGIKNEILCFNFWNMDKST